MVENFDPDDYYDDLEEEQFEEEPSLEELLELVEEALGDDLKGIQTDSEDYDDLFRERKINGRKICDRLANLLDDE
jgi:hypothetical protein